MTTDDRLYGKMTTDYFAFFCGKCKARIPHITMLSHSGYVREFSAHCDRCDEESLFKLEVFERQALDTR